MLYHTRLFAAEGVKTGEALLAFWYALKLDTATAGYILIIPVLILFIQGLFGANWLNTVNKVYSILVILAWSVITSVELASFSEWKYKLNTGAFMHLHNAKEAYYSISAGQFFSLLIVLIILTGGSYLIYTKIFYIKIRDKVRPLIFPILFLIFSIPSLFIMLRGGFNDISISESAAFYSNHSVLNWSSVNSGYHFAVNVMETSRYKKSNNYKFYAEDEAEKTVDSILKTEKDTTVFILRDKRPNIVILLMESWTADLMESMGGRPDVTPNFANLEKEGLLFTQFYCSGNRSHEGTASLLGGLPALPYTTFTANPVKFSKLPSLVKILNNAGYRSSFYYGGQLDYGNMRAYLHYNQFHDLIEEKDIESRIPRGRLGVHDEYMYQRHIKDLKNATEPFFSVLFTLSSHSPYDYPMEDVIDWAGTENKFMNSAHYADKCLGEYFEMAKQQAWYDNTIFIIVADHGHNSFKNWRYESYEYHRIPLFFYGNMLKEEYRGIKIDRIADNSSIAKTLLNQLELPADEFKWGSDLFNPFSPEFAYIVLNDGYAWKSPEGEIVYSMMWKHFYKKDFPEGTKPAQTDSFIREAKSYVQVLFQEFLEL